jgi:hypothetical protein
MCPGAWRSGDWLGWRWSVEANQGIMVIGVLKCRAQQTIDGGRPMQQPRVAVGCAGQGNSGRARQRSGDTMVHRARRQCSRQGR